VLFRSKRGWDVNFGKTVLGLNFYASRTEAETAAMRTQAADLFGSYQNDAGQGIAVEEEGMVFLGTPIGEERPDVTGPDARGAGGFQAAVPLGNPAYRERTVQGFIDDHDARLRQVVALGLRDGRSHTGLTHLSKQLAHHLLRHCCNSRDVHLLRGLPRRIVREAALRHDRAVKAALAAIGGYIDPPPAEKVHEDGTVVKHYLHEVTDDAYPSGFNVGYAQMELPFGQPLALGKCCGGFNMRRWADFGDAAFVGQFALTVQSAIAPSGITYFPVLEDVLTQAHDLPADAMPIARDLQGAWERSVATLRQVSAATPGVADKCAGWLEKTEGDIRNLARMPEQAQRSISQSVVAVQVQTFRHTVRNDPDGGSAKRYDNWLAECNAVASAAWQATAWVSENEQQSF
jgi:hypothetical protein